MMKCAVMQAMGGGRGVGECEMRSVEADKTAQPARRFNPFMILPSMVLPKVHCPGVGVVGDSSKLRNEAKWGVIGAW